MNKPKLIRITTVPISLKILLKGQHRFMSENGFEVIGVSGKGQLLQDVQDEESIRVVELEMLRTISIIKDLKALWIFYKLCKKEKPSIVHSHTPKAGIIGMLGAKLAGVPIRLHTVAGLPLMETSGARRKVLDFVERLTYASATRVYPNSIGLYDYIVEQKYTKLDKLKVIANGSSNGIDTSHFDPKQISSAQKTQLRNDLGIEEIDFVYIFVGRMVGDKGINELVKAFKRLNKSVYRIKLLLVGPFETELDPLQQQTLEEIKENISIIYVGFQQDVRPYFAISDCLVFPSYREGFPNVVMQAGLMNLPCIVTNITGCNEIIIEGENGTIIPVKNSEALAQAMRKMISDKVYYNNLKVNARAMIQTRYEQSTVWNALLEEYNLLVNKLNK
jgi:glycosyltransferase involved in cell wall biosynthesis